MTGEFGTVLRGRETSSNGLREHTCSIGLIPRLFCLGVVVEEHVQVATESTAQHLASGLCFYRLGSLIVPWCLRS